MSQLRPRFTVRWMMAAVVIAAWIALNMRIWFQMEAESPGRDDSVEWLARFLALIAAPAIGVSVALLVRRFHWFDGLPERSFFRIAFEWGFGGAAAWFLAMIALFIGRPFDGFIPPCLCIYTVMGGTCNAAAGLLWAIGVRLLGRRESPIPWIEDSMYLPEGGATEIPSITDTRVTSRPRPESARRTDPKRRGNPWLA
jgi:hypothetical protein